jgi:SNF2 family DNA or RNA helicase
MSTQEPESDDLLEQQLLASLAAVQERKRIRDEAARAERAKLIAAEHEAYQEYEQREQRTKKVIVNVYMVQGGQVFVKSTWRDDILAIWRAVPGRTYNDYNHSNGVPLKEWPSTIAQIQLLPNVEVKYEAGVEHEIKYQTSAPPFLVEMDSKTFVVTSGPRSNTWDLRQIPGVTQVSGTNKFKIPYSEGWRIYEALEDTEGVVYSDEASRFITDQMEKRARLDETAQLEDCELDVKLRDGFNLMPFQKVGVKFAVDAGGKVILGHEMGLGKSPMSIAFAEHKQQERERAWRRAAIRSKDAVMPNHVKTLIVCPASLKSNWMRQVYKVTGQMPLVLSGLTPNQQDMIKLLTEMPRYTIINYDIVGRKQEIKKETVDKEGYTHVDQRDRWLWVELINMAKPDVIIIDEAHYIKNTDSGRSQGVRKLKAENILCLTGTPVLNRPGELWPMLTMLAPETFPSEERFVQQYTVDGKSPKNVDELRQLMRPIMIRKLKKDVVKDLPPINRITEFHEMSERSRKVYEKVMQGVYESIAAYDAKGVGKGSQEVTNILAQIGRLKQVCAIDKVDATAELAMGLVESMAEDENGKVLIFSHYTAVAYAISRRLAEDDNCLCFVERAQKNWKVADSRERDSLVQRFQNEKKWKYLIVTENTAKEGHDITKAGAVIFNDLFWTPAAHQQGEGRAYGRMDNSHSITSYYQIVEDSIEEWIWELLQKKLNIIEQVVEGVEASRDSGVAMELIEKMKQMMWRK